jgi:hypothetical protein
MALGHKNLFIFEDKAGLVPAGLERESVFIPPDAAPSVRKRRPLAKRVSACARPDSAMLTACVCVRIN